MKLLCVVPSYWPAFQFGGPTFSVHGLNKALVKKGVDVTVYTTNVGLDNKVSVNKKVNVDEVKVTYFEFVEFLEILGAMGWQFSLPMAKALKNNMKDFDIVYIVSIWNFPTAIAAYYCRKYKKPYIISPRGHLYPYTYRKKSWKKFPYYHLFARRDLKGAAVIHYTTEDEAKKCHTTLRLNNQAIIIPNGIDLSEFYSPPTKESFRDYYPTLKDKKVILFLGRINWKKGLDILVKAYVKLAKQRNDTHLLIVGNDEEGYGRKVKAWLENYELKYEDYGLKDRDYEVLDKVQRAQSKEQRAQNNKYNEDVKVTFTGMLNGSDKLEVLTGSDLFVLPSYSENFGMAVLEAMACGLPVIISNQVGIHKEVSEAKAGLVIGIDEGQLAKTVYKLLDDAYICNEMGKNGKRLVREKFSCDVIADRMIRTFGEILNEKCI